ncbi:hypothetical protein T492DRAFT_1005864 [Pavlovales sp. CCMP2436]|nr:hypothetical protein T492DRAFT_1005864 [Pavlovales sp. CCMP2436]
MHQPQRVRPATEPPATACAWPRRPFVPLAVERSLLPALVCSRAERGMMRVQPGPRLPKLRTACERLGITLEQALSLRRHHIGANHKGRSADLMQLGSPADVLASSTHFEEAVAEYLRAAGVVFLSEADQKAQKGTGLPTPDFLLRVPLTIRTTHHALDEISRVECRRDTDGILYSEQIVNDFYRDGGRSWAAMAPPSASAHTRGSEINTVNWIEAKFFYAASSVAMDGKSAVGKLHAVVEKYVRQFGPGALVLAYGSGAEIAAELEARGAIVLDASPLDLRALHAHMRTWCAGADGELLP